MSNVAIRETVTAGMTAAREFRTILGHFPTGVVVVTALDDNGDPVGMTVGSFTSVSLDPPLIGFLPTRGSRTFARLRGAKSFCVNVLAADQEWLCRRFASSPGDGPDERFADITWEPAPSGAPVIGDVVAWIDCELADVADAGDHFFALGRVTDLRVVRPVQPLLFFQGGYGRFVPLSRSSAHDAEVISGTRLAEAARPFMERLAADLDVECSAMTAAGGDLMTVATATPPGLNPVSMVGQRIPLRPPLGELYVAWQGADAAESWLASAANVDAETRENYRRRLDLSRERGWSMSLANPDPGADDDGGTPHESLWEALREYSWSELTPARQRAIEQEIARMSRFYEPTALVSAERYDVHSLVAPVFGEDGTVVMVLRLTQLPRGIDGAEVQRWLSLLLETARELSAGGGSS